MVAIRCSCFSTKDNHAMLLLHSALPHHTVASLVAAFHRGDVEALESVDVEERIQWIESELDGLGWVDGW